MAFQEAAAFPNARKTTQWMRCVRHQSTRRKDTSQRALAVWHKARRLRSTVLGEWAGVYHLTQMLKVRKLKVFSSLSGFRSEYRTMLFCDADGGAPMDASQSGAPIKRMKPRRLMTADRDWMA